MEVTRGEVYGIIGTSGAGKSTLFRCLTGLEFPTSGQILIDEVDIATHSKEAVRFFRKRVGMIFQHFNLFSSRNVFDNICYPLEIADFSKKARYTRVQELLALVGLEGKEMLYPSQLSGGQKQRVAIARALITEPKILLCDEATSALDPTMTQQILELLRKLNSYLGLTIVLITHEMAVVKEICTRLSVIDQGTVVETGSVGDLFTKPMHEMTKKLLGTLHHEPPEVYDLGKGEIIRLCFRGENTHKPIISQIIKNYDVGVNILLGSIDKLVTENVGNLVIELSGTREEREKVRLFLQNNDIHWEAITR
jgi:D-methionine transport system ATP-binding protein